jgi:LysM repeat protein
MAGGIDSARQPALIVRTALRAARRRSRAFPALAVAVTLVACAEQSAQPTLAPAPTLVVVTATPGPPPVPTPGQQQRYVVREGDTLSGIAARFGVSEDAIKELNPLSDPNRLLVGQELIIPPAQP